MTGDHDLDSVVALRRFAPADARAVSELVVGIQRGEFGVPITLADQPDLVDVSGHYQVGRGDFWVAQVGEAVVGTIGLLDYGEGAALRKMFVAQPYRGSAHRVGHRLVDTLVAHARRVAIPRIVLGTRPEMTAAHRFYAKHGFTPVAVEELPPTFPRMATDSLFFQRDL